MLRRPIRYRLLRDISFRSPIYRFCVCKDKAKKSHLQIKTEVSPELATLTPFYQGVTP